MSLESRLPELERVDVLKQNRVRNARGVLCKEGAIRPNTEFAARVVPSQIGGDIDWTSSASSVGNISLK